MNKDNLFRKALKTPPSGWRKLAETRRRHDQEMQELADALEFLGTRACLLAEYINQRRGGYCGNHEGHDRAAKAVTKLHKKLRRTLGFSYPDSGLLNL